MLSILIITTNKSQCD